MSKKSVVFVTQKIRSYNIRRDKQALCFQTALLGKSVQKVLTFHFKYTDRYGKQYLFHEIKPKIKNLNPNTVMEHIIAHADPENIFFFGPDD